jgi:hypothetical protein
MTSFSASHALAGAVRSARFSSQASVCASSRPAIRYTLPAGQAMTVQARESGVLRMAGGRLWVTFSPAASDERAPAGDHFLGFGESLRLSAGQTVVMEPLPEAAPGAAMSACFSWQADAPRHFLASLRHALGLAA